MAIKIVATKDQWLKFVERSSAGKCEFFEFVTLKVDGKKVEVEETSKCGTAHVEVKWLPQLVKGSGKITVKPEKLLKALGALSDAGPISATFDGTIAEFEGTNRWIKFNVHETPEGEDKKFPTFPEFIIDIEVDADVLLKAINSAISAVEPDLIKVTFFYKGGVVSLKVGDFETTTGGEMTIPVASSMARKKEVETFESSHGEQLRNMLAMGGKVKLSIGNQYPLKITVEDKVLGSVYYLAPAVQKEEA